MSRQLEEAKTGLTKYVASNGGENVRFATTSNGNMHRIAVAFDLTAKSAAGNSDTFQNTLKLAAQGNGAEARWEEGSLTSFGIEGSLTNIVASVNAANAAQAKAERAHRKEHAAPRAKPIKSEGIPPRTGRVIA